jgi:hypothetical protein
VGEFEDLRDRLRQARSGLETTTADVRAVEQRLKRIGAAEAELARGFNPTVPDLVVARERLQNDRRRANADLKAAHLRRGEAARDEAALRGQFATFSDPRSELPRLNDATPILLMPVRIETRFQTVFIPGPVPGHHFLCVRIYPDDCWIDTFDASLTDTELTGVRAYWTAIWQAGGIEQQERAAWRSLVRAHGAGRASYLVEALKPANLAVKPAKARPEDVVLTIVTDTPLTASEQGAIVTFWRDAWLAEGDAGRLTAARSALTTAVGEARAAEIVARLRPENFDTPPAEGVARGEIGVSVASLVFDRLDQTREAWSSAPRVTLLPDRFVVMAFRSDDTPIAAIGRPIPSTVFTGPDPSARADEQLRMDGSGNLTFPNELAWIADYEKAAEIGMGVTLELSQAQRRFGFDRVIVLGVRMSADEKTTQAELENLLRHHAFTRGGLRILPQGTPTNNTDAVSSAAGREDEAEGSFDDRRAPLFIPTSKWFDKKDGQWLAEAVGIDPALFAHVRHAGGVDQSCARAVNIALWPGTLGYWMASMMAPVFPPGVIDLTRTLFTRYVVASGAIPAIRIGTQPYGIVPVTALSRMKWFNQSPVAGSPADPLATFAGQVYPVLQALEREWRSLVPHVSFIGKSDGDPHQALLDVLGLHSGSVEWSSREAESRMSLFNRLNLQGVGSAMGHMVSASQWVNARELLTRLGYQGAEAPIVLDYLFSGTSNLLKGGVVDDQPLSEVDGIRIYTTAGANYLQWLIDAASASLDQLYAQDGFIDDTPPTALLYLLLRHALQLGYYEASLRLHEQAGLMTAAQAAAARIDQPILHVSSAPQVSESRYQLLFRVEPAIAGAGSRATVADVIATRMPELAPASQLREQIAALGRLKHQPTARLERAFADHVDCCSYRLDAWTLGLVNYQLATMRGTRPGDGGPARQGIHLGAYGWVEEVRPREQPFSSPPPVVFDDPALAADFAKEGEAPLTRAAGNQGFVHAPSLNQAVAAAVLRNGYISTATPETRDTLSVNLTSERMRTAMWLLDGVRAGQSLSDLLGYQFERSLHDRHGLVEVDKFIYPLRKVFPLRGDRLQDTATLEGVAIESIEARNVIDGLAFANHLKTGMHHYPFEKAGLPPATQAEATAIDREAERLLVSYDAVADLALAEGVYQAVLGNYDRATANYDAYARGGLPPQPEIIRTPSSAVGLTHRVAVHLAGGVDPRRSPDPALTMTPRAQTEPAVNAWLAALLPPLSSIGCIVRFHDASAHIAASGEITLERLGLQPTDLVAVAGGSADAMSELDDRISELAMATFGGRPDVPITIRYMERKAAALSVFEVLPLCRALKAVLSGARPLGPSDLSLPSDAKTEQDAAPRIDRQRIVLAEGAMRTLADDCSALSARIDGALSDHRGGRSDLVAAVDALASDVASVLARAALFGIPQAGREFIREFRRRVFAGVLAQVGDVAGRWTTRLAEFDARLAAHDALPPTATEADRMRVLAAAETAISARPILPRPSTSAELRAQLADKRTAFIRKRMRLASVQQTRRITVAELFADVRALLPIDDVDPTPFSLDAHERAVVQFVEQAKTVVASMHSALTRRLTVAATQTAAHDASGVAVERVRALDAAAKALFGDDFLLVPEFTLPSAQRDEIANALAASRSGALFEHLVHPPDSRTPPIDFPVDTWLHGAARVRERLHAWEQVVILTGAFGRSEPPLDALQLPHVPQDKWIGLDLPAGEKLDADRLLYAAHFAAAPDASGHLSGLLLDEWTETIPASDLDTGIAFHFDRPNAEAPQTMLLVTPAEFRGGWQWEDLVDAVNETLDLARRRAIEPAHLDTLPLAPYLPATVMATQVGELTIAANLALNNQGVRSGE